MIQFGKRHNIIYPSFFVLFLFLRRIIKLLIERTLDYYGPFLLIFVMFISEFFTSIILLYINRSKKKRENSIKNQNIKLIANEMALEQPDNGAKIILLIIFASFFEFVGAITRRYLFHEIDESISELFHNRLRSLEIIISAILCYFTLGIEIYYHQRISLYIISFCLVVVFSVEFICFDEYKTIYNGLLVVFISSMCRAFLDTIEKYLFEVDYADVFRLTFIESAFDIIFSLFMYLFKKPRRDISYLFNSNRYSTNEIIIIIILLLVYGILSGLKNIYRRYTVKLYSPMTRALAESLSDPIFVFVGAFNEEFESCKYEIFHFSIIFFFSLIMVICSLIYNEFLIFYFCNMELETHVEITNRAKTVELTFKTIDDSGNQRDSENQRYSE